VPSQYKAFSIQAEYYPILRRWTTEERGILLLALIDWADGKPPAETEIEPRIRDIFELITSSIERISAKNRINGALGGRPKKHSGTKYRAYIGDDAASITHEDLDSLLNDDPDPDDPPNTVYHGKNGFVRLSGTEYSKLKSDFGQECLNAAIDELDVWAARENPKNVKKWYDIVQNVLVRNRTKIPKSAAFTQSNPRDIPSAEDYNKEFTRRPSE
jgi:hypothetical protein